MPPLRERLCDIPELAAHFMQKICRLENIPPKQIAADTLDRMAAHSWPGNVRQLENAVEMAVALSGERRVLSPADFRLPQATFAGAPSPVGQPSIPVPDDGIDFEQIVSRFERSILEQALQKTGGNKKMAAEMLRLKRTTLSAKLRSLEAAG
jgi:DNA-binding NtrC family response regulator